jgi:alpha-amylase/alpha-mannosidase (GH57 family)
MAGKARPPIKVMIVRVNKTIPGKFLFKINLNPILSAVSRSLNFFGSQTTSQTAIEHEIIFMMIIE